MFCWFMSFGRLLPLMAVRCSRKGYRKVHFLGGILWLQHFFFLLPIPLDEPLLISLLVGGLHMPASVRASLYNLFAFVHSKIVSVLS